jgi:hypothetical protein
MTAKCGSCEWARRRQCQAQYLNFTGECYFEDHADLEGKMGSMWRPAKICKSGRPKGGRGGA